MTRAEALFLLNVILDVNSNMTDRQLAATRLAELLRILLPEE